jgi:hypothetical protein
VITDVFLAVIAGVLIVIAVELYGIAGHLDRRRP